MPKWVSLMDRMEAKRNLETGHAEACPQMRWDNLDGHEATASRECPCCRDGVLMPDEGL
jgi:hypothetical protein